MKYRFLDYIENKILRTQFRYITGVTSWGKHTLLKTFCTILYNLIIKLKYVYVYKHINYPSSAGGESLKLPLAHSVCE